MRLLILGLVLGLAAAEDFLQKSAPVVDENVQAFLQGASEAGSLAKALGIDDPIINQLADDIEADLGKKIQEALNELLEKIKDNVDNGKAVGQELVDKVKGLREELRKVGGDKEDKMKEMLQKIREKAKEALRKILERLGLGKRNLDDSMDQVARMNFRGIVDLVRDKIVSKENIKKIREYIENLPEDKNPLVQNLKKWIVDISDEDLIRLLKELFPQSPEALLMRGETWSKLKDFFKNLNLQIQEHSKKFGEWVKDKWGKGLEKLKDKYGTIKAIAMEFIANSKDMSAEMSREALEFFRPYKDDLGSLWNKLVDATKESIGKF